jgi:phosphoglycerate dehydrogenase-like enzyme
MKILSQVTLSNEEIERLKSVLPGLEVVVETGIEGELREVEDADIFFGRIPREVFIKGKNLKWVQVFGAGVETQFFPELVQSDAILCNTSGAYNQTMADQAFALILGISRGVAMSERNRPKRAWGQTRVLRQLGGQTLGIIGLGNIGCEIARRGKAFGMNVLASDLMVNECPVFVDKLWGLDNMDEVLKESDYLVLIVPLTDKTRGMIGAEQLKKMKPTAHLINVGRGPLVDETALINALKTGVIAGAGLDVFMVEPLPADSELWDMENVVMTPHIGGLSPETRAISYEIFLENFKKFVKGEPLRNVVDKKRQF